MTPRPPQPAYQPNQSPPNQPNQQWKGYEEILKARRDYWAASYKRWLASQKMWGIPSQPWQGSQWQNQPHILGGGYGQR